MTRLAFTEYDAYAEAVRNVSVSMRMCSRQVSKWTLQYLRIQRLYEARRLLRASGQDRTTVTQVAFALGFWDLGRFAGRYRTLFGEHPSETLRERRSRSACEPPANKGKGRSDRRRATVECFRCHAPQGHPAEIT